MSSLLALLHFLLTKVAKLLDLTQVSQLKLESATVDQKIATCQFEQVTENFTPACPTNLDAPGTGESLFPQPT